jgi:hypothetical protein
VVCCDLAAAAWYAEVASSGSVGVRALMGIIVLHVLKRGEP